jgi:hypothetical protein
MLFGPCPPRYQTYWHITKPKPAISQYSRLAWLRVTVLARHVGQRRDKAVTH